MKILLFQLLRSTSFEHPADVVRWLGAVQAQDYLGSLWANRGGGGELTHYSTGGNKPFNPPELHAKLGMLWPVRSWCSGPVHGRGSGHIMPS